MKLNNGLLKISLLCLGFTSIGMTIPNAKAADLNTQGGKGAKVYCYMRSNGNAHEVSWNASYALLKRQSNSMFKTSPKHAAVMITEAVVQDPNKFPNCGQYLGDLFQPKETPIKSANINNIQTNQDSKYNTNSASRYNY